MTPTLDLWPIGNCQVSALIDRQGRFVWGCVPRVDGDPLFSALLGGEAPEAGKWRSGCLHNPYRAIISIVGFCPTFCPPLARAAPPALPVAALSEPSPCAQIRPNIALLSYPDSEELRGACAGLKRPVAHQGQLRSLERCQGE